MISVDMFAGRISRCLVVLFLVLTGCSQPTFTHKLQGSIFGTTWSIQLISEQEVDQQRLEQSINTRLQTIDSIMSTWNKDSELSLFNSHFDGEWFPVSPELSLVVTAAREIHDKTSGAFDPTLGPLIHLWGFDHNSQQKVPEPEAIAVAKSRIGMDAVEVSRDNKGLRKTKSVSLNLSAIAKGYAVDQVAEILIQRGINNFLVEIGGELSIRGDKNGQPWIIGIERPDPESRQLHLSIEASNTSVATSGDYRNFFEEKGVRFSHILDPRTGYPVTHNLLSVTVLAQDTMTADAYATAFMVLGQKQSLKIAKQQGLAIYMLVANAQKDSFEAVYSDNFIPYLKKNGS